MFNNSNSSSKVESTTVRVERLGIESLLVVCLEPQFMNGERMKKEDSNPVPAEIQPEINALAALSEAEIDTNDLPEVRDWRGAKRGVFYRSIKQSSGINYVS